MRLFRRSVWETGVIELDEHFGDPQGPRLEEAIRSDPLDWATVQQILRTAPTREHLSHYIKVAAAYTGFEGHLTEYLRQDPSDQLTRLLLGARMVDWAWEARGTGTSDTVAADTWKVWFHRLGLAEETLDEVLRHEPDNAEAWRWLITLGFAQQVPAEEQWRRFEGLIAIDPTHYYGHQQMLEALKEKWGGSHQEMLDFARSRAASAPGTNLPVLIAEAHYELTCYVDRDDYLEQPEVAAELIYAAEQSIWHPQYQGTLLSWEVRNLFAYLLTCAERHKEAVRLYEEIGDDHVTYAPWGYEFKDPVQSFRELRLYSRNSV
jgi:hypothetical protein